MRLLTMFQIGKYPLNSVSNKLSVLVHPEFKNFCPVVEFPVSVEINYFTTACLSNW